MIYSSVVNTSCYKIYNYTPNFPKLHQLTVSHYGLAAHSTTVSPSIPSSEPLVPTANVPNMEPKATPIKRSIFLMIPPLGGSTMGRNDIRYGHQYGLSLMKGVSDPAMGL